jgi:predicted RND superfamily exporter protein
MIPKGWIHAYLHLLLRYRVAVAALVGAATLFLAYGLKDLQLQVDFRDFLPPGHPYVEFSREFERMLGTPNVLTVILEVKRGDIYNPTTLQKLDRITRFMIYTKGVVPYQIYSIAHAKVRSITVTAGGTINVRELFHPGVPQTQDDAERVRFKVYADPAIRGVFTATDDTAAVVHTGFWSEGLDYDDLRERMRELRHAEEDDNHVIHVTGLPWLYASVLEYTAELYIIFALTGLSLVVLLYAYFRTWTAIWVPLFSALLSSVWGLGMAAWFGFNFDPLVLVIPIFLTARALSHSVQSMDRYHQDYRFCGDKQLAIVTSYSHLFPPAIASIITDGLALLVVAVTPIPLVQKVALFASFWVISILVSVVTLHPIILSFSRPPAVRSDRWTLPLLNLRAATGILLGVVVGAVAAGRTLRLPLAWPVVAVLPVVVWYWLTYSEAVYGTLTRWVIQSTAGRRRWAVLAMTVGLYLSLPLWGWTLKVGDLTPGAALLFANHPYNVGYSKLNQKFLGASQLIIVADSLRPDGLKDEEALRTIDELTDHMHGAAGAVRAFSVTDIIKLATRVWHDGDPKWAAVPAGFRERTELLFVFSLAGAGETSRFTDRSARYATISTLFHTHSHAVIMDAIRWAQQFDGSSGGVQLRFAGGLFGLLAAINESVERSYWLNLGLIFAIIYVCLYLTYRSWAASTILMIPVVLSQLAAEALMVLLHIDLNVNSLPVAAAGAGVGVDYGIYHFSRMLDAHAELGNVDDAVDYATATTGKAIIFTASTMLAATAFWWTSHLKFQAEMGMLLALLMLFNTFGGLVVVPAFVKALRPRFLDRVRRVVSGLDGEGIAG